MMKSQATLVVLCALLALLHVATAKWKLVWSDDFNGKKVDKKKWDVIDKWRGYDGELQGYMAKNVKVRGGKLHLTAKKENANVKFYDTDSTPVSYTSGEIVSRFKFAQKHGRFAVKAKFPRGKGLWGAAWLMPSKESYCWPQNGEIDIVEQVGADTKAWYATYHNGPKCNNDPSYDDANDHGRATSWLPTTADLSSTFHEYAVEWDSKTIKWFYDNKLAKTVYAGQKDPEKTWITLNLPPHGMGFILNLAIGDGVQEWPGAPDASTKFPATMIVDYARIYKKSSGKKKGGGGKHRKAATNKKKARKNQRKN